MNRIVLVTTLVALVITAGCAAPEPPARHSVFFGARSGPATVRAAPSNVRVVPHNARSTIPGTPYPGGILVRSVATSKSDTLPLVLKRNQSVSVKGKTTTFKNLVTTLRSQGARESMPLFLQVETGTPYADVVTVLSLLQASGFTNLAVVNNKTAGTSTRKTKLKR